MRALPLLAAVFLLAACGSSDDGAPALPLEGTTWVLVSYDGPAVPEGVSVDLLLEEGRASGNSGCNSYSGGYELAGDELTFGPMAATQMACPPDQMDVEAAYLAALERTASYQMEGEEAVFFDPRGTEMLRFAEAGDG